MARQTPETTLQQRLEIAARAEAGESDGQIAAALHWSPMAAAAAQGGARRADLRAGASRNGRLGEYRVRSAGDDSRHAAGA